MIRCARGFVAGALFFMALVPAVAHAKDNKPPVPQLSADEQKILDLANKERKKKNRPPLRPNGLLVKAARRHTRNMARQQKMDHVLDGKDPGQRIRATGYRYRWYGENIGERFSPSQMVKGWMESKPHRANLLNKRAQEVGIGIARDDRGRTYYTAVFAAPRSCARYGFVL